jgi:hypothetical protein
MIRFSDFEKIFESEIDKSLPSFVKELISEFSEREDVFIEPWYEVVMKHSSKSKLHGIRLYIKDILFRINWKNINSNSITIDVWLKSKDEKQSPEWTISGTASMFASIPGMILKMINELSMDKPVTKRLQLAESMDEYSQETPRVVRSEPENTVDPATISEEEIQGLNVLDDLRNMLMLIIDNINPSLIVCGRGGVGKTHTVTKTFEEFGMDEGDDYVMIKGASSALSMYKALYYNNGKTLVFDDCDSVFRDEDAVNILKAALDSNDRRKISWLSRSTYDPATETPTKTRPVPNTFEFDGCIVFISNLPIESIDEAVRTRSYIIDVSLNQKQVFVLIERNLAEILPTVSSSIKEEVLDYMKTSYKSKHGEMVNFRTFIKSVKIRMSGHPNWKSLINKYA